MTTMKVISTAKQQQQNHKKKKKKTVSKQSSLISLEDVSESKYVLLLLRWYLLFNKWSSGTCPWL